MKKKQLHPEEKKSFLNQLDSFLGKNDFLCFWLIFGIALFTAILLYDPRVSLTGDDSAYILRANAFLKKFAFPDFQGPLYPITLSLVARFSGAALMPLKVFSLVSFLAFLYITFITFRKRIPASLLFSVLLLVSINSHVLYYASQTFNEAFYFFIQSLLFLVFFRLFIDKEQEKLTLLSDVKRHLLLALALLAAGLTRSIGFSLLAGLIVYFIFSKQWKNIGISILCFGLIFLSYSLLKTMIWGDSSIQFSTQGSGLLFKDYYRPELGKEDLSGFITRFLENSDQYLSFNLFNITGFNLTKPNPLLAIMVYFLACIGLFFTFKKNNYLFFTGIVCGGFLVASFISLQVLWNQERLIIPTYPYILLIVFTAFYFLLCKEKFRHLQLLYILPIVILLFMGLKETSENIESARKIKDEYSGLTPDWLHYTKASHWIGKNLGKEDVVACRKAPISTVYAGGKDFHGIYSVPTGDAAAFMKKLEAAPNKYTAVVADRTFPEAFYQLISNEYVARVELEQKAYLILNANDSVQASLQQNNIQFTPISEIQQSAQKANNNFAVFYADSLLLNLKNGKVTHIMTANLRFDPRANTGSIISTVERYAYYIQEKYPSIFEKVYQEGDDKDEPAQLFKIRWEIIDTKK